MMTNRLLIPMVRLACFAALVIGSAGVARPASARGLSLQLLSGNTATEGVGGVYTWGLNLQGQVGKGTTDPQLSPLHVTLDPNDASVKAVSVSAGGYHSLALDSNGKVYAWGGDSWGELGDGGSGYQKSPVKIKLDAGVKVVAVSAGYTHSLALDSSGRVYAWGDDHYGELGKLDPGQLIRTPVAVSLPVAARAVSAGYGYSLVVGSDGKVYAWGADDYGQLGDGSLRSFTSSPVAVSLDPSNPTVKAIAVSAGDCYSLAMSGDGKIYAWGDNRRGQLGDGTASASPQLTPKHVSLVPGDKVTAVAVSAGQDPLKYGHSLAVGSDGRVYAWGDNQYGQLGNGTASGSPQPNPLPVNLANGFTMVGVSAGERFSLAVSSDGKAYTWGWNHYGQLGDGVASETLQPTPVAVDLPGYPQVTAVAVSAGGGQSLALSGTIAPAPVHIPTSAPSPTSKPISVPTFTSTPVRAATSRPTSTSMPVSRPTNTPTSTPSARPQGYTIPLYPFTKAVLPAGGTVSFVWDKFSGAAGYILSVRLVKQSGHTRIRANSRVSFSVLVYGQLSYAWDDRQFLPGDYQCELVPIDEYGNALAPGDSARFSLVNSR